MGGEFTGLHALWHPTRKFCSLERRPTFIDLAGQEPSCHLPVELTLSEAQHCARLAVYMTDTIVVRLMEEPGGGYRWRLLSADPATLEMIDQRYEPARADVGSAGASVWTFKPKKTGRTRLALMKLRPWIGGDPPAEQFAVDLDIR